LHIRTSQKGADIRTDIRSDIPGAIKEISLEGGSGPGARVAVAAAVAAERGLWRAMLAIYCTVQYSTLSRWACSRVQGRFSRLPPGVVSS